MLYAGLRKAQRQATKGFITTLTHQQKMQKKGGMGKNLPFNEEINQFVACSRIASEMA